MPDGLLFDGPLAGSFEADLTGRVIDGELGSEAAIEQRRAASRAAIVVVASRLLLAVAALITTYTVGVQARALWLRDPARIEVFHGVLKRVLEPWANWDGVWFIRIAADGYAAHVHSQAFFPLYPLAVRAVAFVAGHNYVVAGLVVSLACYGAAMAVLFALAKAELGARAALWAVVFISVFPTALFFQAVYSESLFLLLTLLSFWWARGGRWPLAGIAGLLAVLTRSTGVLLVLPMAVFWWEQRSGRALRLPGGPRDLPAAGAAGVTPASGGAPETSPAASGRRPSGLSAAWLLLVPAGLALYMGYLWQAFHDALLFGSVQSFWGRELTFPGTAVWNGARTALRSLGWLAAHGVGTILGVHTASGGLNSDVIANLLEFIGFVVAVALLVACWRRLSAAYTLYALAALLFPLLYSTAERPLYSLPRFVVVVFPLFMGMAAVLAPRPVWRWVATAVFVLLLLGSTVLFASFI